MPKTVAGNVPCDMATMHRLLYTPDSREQRVVARVAHQVITQRARANKMTPGDVFGTLRALGDVRESDRDLVESTLAAYAHPGNAPQTDATRAVLNACPRVTPAVQKRVRW